MRSHALAESHNLLAFPADGLAWGSLGLEGHHDDVGCQSVCAVPLLAHDV